MPKLDEKLEISKFSFTASGGKINGMEN